MKVLNEYKGSHHYTEEWNKTEYHCMNCSAHSVWAEEAGDYYAGETHVCTDCGYCWSMPGRPRPMSGDNNLMILEQLREEKTFVPKTVKGN